MKWFGWLKKFGFNLTDEEIMKMHKERTPACAQLFGEEIKDIGKPQEADELLAREILYLKKRVEYLEERK